MVDRSLAGARHYGVTHRDDDALDVHDAVEGMRILHSTIALSFKVDIRATPFLSRVRKSGLPGFAKKIREN